MILDAESWMNIRRFRALHDAGASYAEIGRECGCNWRTVRKYLSEEGVALPPRTPSRAGRTAAGDRAVRGVDRRVAPGRSHAERQRDP